MSQKLMVNYEFERKSLNSVAAAKLFCNALHSGTHRVDPNFESSNFKRT